ncbi:hypothetical protein RRG08_066905 [Elysia crispata]|uniref:Uncharacterized protein n=1 Tax=Elysia crispata TaxID=231223 RepID=A0AAE0Y1T8_9GAST|nr:hypothetical protein RRG08_066905 [Elysia crispata]
MIKSWNDERIFTVSEDCNKTIGLIQDKEQTFPMSLLVLLLIISCWTPVEPACGPLREGQPGTLSCAAITRCPSDTSLREIPREYSLSAKFSITEIKSTGQNRGLKY